MFFVDFFVEFCALLRLGERFILQGKVATLIS